MHAEAARALLPEVVAEVIERHEARRRARPAAWKLTVPAALVHGCIRWLAAYAGHEDECYLRCLVEYALTQ